MIRVVALAASFAVACGAPPSPELPPTLALTFVADFNVPRDGSFDELGGISAIAYDEDAGTWLAVSDARVDSRFYELSIRFEDDVLRVEPRGATPMVDANGDPFAKNVLDPEAVVLTSANTLVISTEPDSRDQPVEQAKLLELGRDGKLVRRLDVPEKFVVEGWPPEKGLRNNAGFEALTASPDGTVFFLGTESSLLQDGDEAGFSKPGFCRLVEYRLVGDSLAPGAEFVYPLGPVPPDAELADVELFVGLVELVALSETKLLALERDFLREPAGERRSLNRARIFVVELGGATDVSAVESLSGGGEWQPVSKELLFDFDDIVHRLSDGFRSVDNLEAMGLGPPLRDGGRSLVVVSDDNFRETQRTAFLLFSLRVGSE